MWLSDTAVKRPILATVVSLLLVAFGLMAFDRMSLREYPNVDPPIVTIDTTYLGASAEVVENRILIVEFANQLRDKGIAFHRALVSATQLRLRPILMTAITTIVGTLPLIFSSGAGSETRYILGVVLFWGVAFATVLSLFIIPAAYALIARNTGSPLKSPHQLEAALKTSEKRR